MSDAVERALPLLSDEYRGKELHRSPGYVDLLEPEGIRPRGIGPALMETSVLPVVYERWWRPALGRIAKGPLGPDMADEKRIARLLLGLTHGDGVLDVACGSGNFTRDFSHAVGPEGLVVGLDASETMLARAIEDTSQENVAYVRGDAIELPFRDASFDAVCCFAALNLISEPMKAIDSMRRVLTPGGRIALFTSAQARTAPLRTAFSLAGRRSGMTIFDQDELVEALRERGFTEVRQRLSGATQFVGGRLAA